MRRPVPVSVQAGGPNDEAASNGGSNAMHRVGGTHLAAVKGAVGFVPAEVAPMHRQVATEEELVRVELGHKEAVLGGEHVDESLEQPRLHVDQQYRAAHQSALQRLERRPLGPLTRVADALDADEDLDGRRCQKKCADRHVLALLRRQLALVRLQVLLLDLGCRLWTGGR